VPEVGAHAGAVAGAVHAHQVGDLVDDVEPVTDLRGARGAAADERVGDPAAVVDLDHQVVAGLLDREQSASRH
jgi:hypothetical protein